MKKAIALVITSIFLFVSGEASAGIIKRDQHTELCEALLDMVKSLCEQQMDYSRRHGCLGDEMFFSEDPEILNLFDITTYYTDSMQALKCPEPNISFCIGGIYGDIEGNIHMRTKDKICSSM